MTALQLLAIISAALLLQVVGGVGVLVWRRRAAAVDAVPSDRPESPVIGAGAWPGWRDFRVQRRGFEDAARSQCSFYLQPVDGAPLPAFRPGQYLTFSVPVGAAGTGRKLTRCYSLSDRPDPAVYRITVKRVPPPREHPELPPGASSNHLHDEVREGDVLRVKAPSGRFFIDPAAGVPAVFIAGGIGITPMMSMLRWCTAEQPERPVHLYYGVRNSADHAFKAVLEELAASHPAFRLHVVYSDPAPEDVQGRDHQHSGRIDLALLRRNLPHGRHQFYVCGPPPMMQSLVPALREWGVQESDIHFEAFGPASVQTSGPATNEPPASAATTVAVRFRRSGRSLVWDGQDANLLDFAERHGVAVDSGCRSGSCGACETKLVSGSVGYAETPDHAIAAGHCLLCVGRPLAPLELEA
ncbi:MAG: 2Fe-2S iron-sulfur cluster-binding protein [Burkholderiaceae bacterium]